MKYEYEFLEGINHYYLTLNGLSHKSFPKSRYSKQEAEISASKVVDKAIKKYGAKVRYDGFVTC